MGSGKRYLLLLCGNSVRDAEKLEFFTYEQEQDFVTEQ